MANRIPKINTVKPNTKGVNTVKFDLFDFGGEKMERVISLDMAYDPTADMLDTAPDALKLSITLGDNHASNSITLPMAMLFNAMHQILAAYKQQKNSGLVGFDKGIVKPS